MTRFTVRLDDMTAAYFDAFAEQFGGRSQAMRALIEEALTTSRASKSSVPEGEGKQRLEVRLGLDDMALLEEAAKARHCKPTWWATQLIHAQLRGKPAAPPLDFKAIFGQLLPKATKAPPSQSQVDLEAAGQLRLLD
ncbi:hypothetical protein [Sphingomonas sp. PAMC 26617]|uniref:hypothetical protein n=1 Tax=Sphingomonas sp. PAMC 26617 TaxID=1112216 RepID=UPI0002880B64|nr:hypothetical protein [Sphingomonas sp. PAMC 26617]